VAPTIKDPVVYSDGFGSNVDFQAFLGSKLAAISIDSTTKYVGTTSLKVTVPGPGDPSGGYAGGAFVVNRPRDLSTYNALTFYAKASRPIAFDVVGLGNDNTGTSKFDARRNAVAMTTSWQRFVIPIPLASRLTAEKGMFYFAEGPESGAGSTVWFDDVQFEFLTGITNPRPSIQSASLTPGVGEYLDVPGTQVTFDVDGADVVVGAMPGYFTFLSTADTVAVGGEGTVHVVGLGTATITAKLGEIPATGSVTVTPLPAPLTAAPTPTLPSADVISLYSNAYTNRTVDTWSASWDVADVADVTVGGNATKKYTNLIYAGIEFTSSTIDASTMTHFHADVWVPSGSVFRVKLVDFGANGTFGGGDDREHELEFNAATSPALQFGAWTSLEVPLSSFTNLTTRGHLAQMIISGDVGTAYLDNVY
ncbi:MAG TPA: hypothetical protein PLV92_26020, partial [Pirellulaceae bacterium]|nr:hypothetical protein [Pirellulaceae bacterium]